MAAARRSMSHALNRVRNYLSTSHRLFGLIIILALGYLVLMPFWEIIATSFTVQNADAMRVGEPAGTPTLYYWQRMLNSPLTERAFLTPLVNTLVVGFFYTILAMALGALLAWLSVRTDMQFRGWIPDLVLVPYVIPSWGMALAWITIFRSDSIPGSPPGLLQQVFGIEAPGWLLYGPVPIIIVLALNYFAFTYLLAAAAFSSFDSSLEEAGKVLGASKGRIFKQITLPLIMPALASAFILTFSQGLGTFGVPAFLGIPDRYFVLSTSLFFNMNTGRTGDAFVFALVIVLMASVTIYMNALILGRRKQFTTISGKGGRRVPTSLGKWRKPVGWAVMIFLFLISVVPLLVLVLQTVSWRIGEFSLENFTLHFWIGQEMSTRGSSDPLPGILHSPTILSATWNSILLGLLVGALVAVVGQVIGYVLSRGRGSWTAQIVDQLSFLPFVIPSIVFGAIYLSLFSVQRGPIPALYGTFALLVIVSVVKRLPFAARSGATSMMQVDPELEEAARIHKAGIARRWWSILLPLTRNGMFVGFLFGFVNTVKDLTLVILLVTPATNVLPALIYTFADRGFRQYSDAVTIVIVVIVLAGTFAARRLTKTDFSRGF